MRLKSCLPLVLLAVLAASCAATSGGSAADAAADAGADAGADADVAASAASASAAGPWDVPVPAHMDPALGMNTSAPASSAASRPPPLDLGGVPGAGSYMPPPIPVDVTQVQVADALEDVARRTEAAVVASGVARDDMSPSTPDFDFANPAAAAAHDSTLVHQLASDADTQQAVGQLAVLLACMGSSADTDSNDPARAAASFRLASSSVSGIPTAGNALEFNPLAAADAPASKWAIARKVGRDVLVLTRYALIVHADAYELTHSPPNRSDEKRPADEPWSRKAITVVDDLIAFLDFVEERLPQS